MTTSTLPRPTTTTEPFSRRRAARIAGIGYVLIFVLAIFANFFVRNGLVDVDDPAATVANISESMTLFRFGIVAFLAVFVLDVVIAWALHIVFRDVDRDVSLLSAWMRLVYTVMLGAALVFLLQITQLVGNADVASAFGSDQIAAQTSMALDSFNFAWLIGLAAFGIHLLLMGYLAVRSGFVPKALGYILMVAGAAYVVDTVANITLANYSDHASLFLAVVAIPSIISEGWFGLWLLLRGGRASETAA